MAISSARVQGGGQQQGSANAGVEQMGALLQGFEQLQQKQQDLDRLQRAQNAKRLWPMVEARAQKMGSMRNLLQTDHGRDIVKATLTESTTYSDDQIDNIVAGWSSLPATEAETLKLLGQEAAMGNEQAMQANNRFYGGLAVGGQQVRQGGTQGNQPPEAIQRVQAEIEKTEKALQGLGPKPQPGQAQGQQNQQQQTQQKTSTTGGQGNFQGSSEILESGRYTEPYGTPSSPSITGLKSTEDVSQYTQADVPSGMAARSQARQQAGGGSQDVASIEAQLGGEEKKETSKEGDQSQSFGQAINTMDRQMSKNHYPEIEKQEAVGEAQDKGISKGGEKTTNKEALSRSEALRVQADWEDLKDKYRQVESQGGRLGESIEEAAYKELEEKHPDKNLRSFIPNSLAQQRRSSESKASPYGVEGGPRNISEEMEFLVQEQGAEEAKEKIQNEAMSEEGKEAVKNASKGGKLPSSEQELLNWKSKKKELESKLDSYKNILADLESGGDKMARSTFRDVNNGKNVSDKRYKIATDRAANSLLSKDELQRIETWANNLEKTGAMNNATYRRRLDPKAAQQADKVTANMMAMEELGIKKDRLQMEKENWMLQKGMMEAERKLKEAQAEATRRSGISPQMLDSMKVLLPEIMDLQQELVKQGKSPKDIQDFYKKNPSMGLTKTLLEKYMKQMGNIEASPVQKDLNILEGFKSLFGGGPAQTYQYQGASPISAGMPGSAGGEGVSSPDVRNQEETMEEARQRILNPGQ